MTSPIETNNVVERLREEADLCRNDGADDIAALLEEAASENQSLSDRIDALEGENKRICSICTAVIASFPQGMCCHCQEMPWSLASLTQGGKNV